jgi:acetyl esterase/lipase
MTSKLAALTGGRVLSVNYRLSPSHPFPSQIIDVLLAYLYLLYPPPGSLHTPVPPSNIVFAADSFGANILLSLLQVILKLNQHFTNSSLNRTITFNNSPVKLPLPAAGAFVSALGYTPEVFPSWDTNKEHDTFPYLPQPYCTTSYFPADAIWPSHPPRGDIYCETSLLAHPILCPSIAKSWHGCPPLYFGEGEERCADSVIVIAQQAVRDVVKVRWETYEEMCHIFMTYFPRLRQSDLVFERWTDFIMRAVEKPSDVVSGASSIAYDLSERAMDVNRLTEIMVEDATGWMMRVRKERKVWTGPTEGQKGKAVL